MSDLVRSWVNNRFYREVEAQTRLSDENIERRKRVGDLSENDKTLIDGVDARLKNQDKQNKECQGIHSELSQEVSKMKASLATCMSDLESHVKVQSQTKLQLSKLEQSVGRLV